MIPKIIHYCWLSHDPIPKRLQQCMATWKKVLPDYKFILWDRSRFDIDSVAWVREAYDAKMYAFAADYIRFYAVYTMGGIYLDMDVEVLRPFGELLCHPYLLGAEYDTYPEAGIFGAEQHSELMQWCMDFYKDKHFQAIPKILTTCKAPQVMHLAFSAHCRLEVSECRSSSNGIITLLPSDYLSAMSADTGIAHPTENTRTIHHFAGSWCYHSPLSQLRRWMKVTASHCLGETLVRRVRQKLSDLYKTLRRKNYVPQHNNQEK